MFKRHNLYVVYLVFLFFTACKKEDFSSLYDYKTLGNSAHDLLSSNTYTSLQIEISYMPGYEPPAAALDSLANFLRLYLNKPAGVQILSHAIPASGKQTLTLDEVVAIEKKNRSAFTVGNALAVHILIADANYTSPDNMALAYWNTSFCLFGKQIFSSSGGAGQISNSKLVATLLQHEFGHLLGLVGQGSPMQQEHRDQDNGAHCQNRSCLMYYGIETAENMGATTPIPVLDAPCMADLKANGGK